VNLKIVHISDVHLRNLKYHADYRRVFENLYRKLDEIKPDLIINTGDSAHTKVNISPEFVEMESEHIRRVIEYAGYHIILGNHDLNLMNLDRQDAITPIVDSIRDSRVHLHKKSGPVKIFDLGVTLWVFSLADVENYPTPLQWKDSSDINIGLFHGSISTCVTDSNWRMNNTEHDVSIFDGLDYAMLGDIHKQQFFRDRTIAYAGSLIQQNFGEEIDKGFLLWDIQGKKKHTVSSVMLHGSRKFHTVKVGEDLSIPDLIIEPDSRIRVSPPRSLTLVEQKALEKSIKQKFQPYDVITLAPVSLSKGHAQLSPIAHSDFDNLRHISVQERLLKKYLSEKNLPIVVMDRIFDLNRKYQIHVDQVDDVSRNVSWQINKIGWSNLFNYGENNYIDFSSLGGLTGIFAPNASGKSNLIDVMLETLFDSTTRGVSKNISLINDNKESSVMVADFTANGQDYSVERCIERIKYGHRKGEAKEWGKTSCGFFKVDLAGSREPLLGVSRPETERSLRLRVGSFEDFMLTGLSAQWNPLDIISCKETRRKEILYRFLDLDIFEQKCILAKEDAKEHWNRLHELEESDIDSKISSLRQSIDSHAEKLNSLKDDLVSSRAKITSLQEESLRLATRKIPVDKIEMSDSVSDRISKCEREIDRLKVTLSEKDDLLREVLTDIDLIEEFQKSFDVVFHTDQIDSLEKIELSLIENSKNVERLMKSQSDGEREISLLKVVPCGDQFPTCRFLVNAFSAKSSAESLRSKIDELNSQSTSLQADASSLAVHRDKMREYEESTGRKASLLEKRATTRLQKENLKLKIDALIVESDSLRSMMQRLEKSKEDILKNLEIDRQLSDVSRCQKSLEKEADEIQSSISDIDRKIGSDQGMLDIACERSQSLVESRAICTAYEHYIDAMGKDGIAYQILTQNLPLINSEINKILTGTAEFGVLIEHDADEQSIRIYLQYGEYKPRLIELGSGAEKMLASVAIRTALLNISNLPKSNMFIIDEGFGKLDSQNLENVNRMFDYLRTIFDHVIVISHLETMKDLVDNMIEITVDAEGYAHVEIGG
jgi:DNA repair exonuclease SbcCD ATPase subunit